MTITDPATPPEGGGVTLPPEDPAPSTPTAWPTEADLAAQLEADPGEEIEDPDDPSTPPADPPPTGNPPAPETPPVDPAAPPVDPAAPPAPEVEAALAELPVKWQSEVKRLRNEAAENRVEAKKFTEAFDGWQDSDVTGFLEIAAGLSSDQNADVEQSARRLLLAGKNILESLGVDVGDIAAPDPNRPMTRAEYQREQERIDAERREQQDLDTRMREIDRQVEELQYEKGSTAHILLLQFAAQSDDGDVQKAHEALQAYNKSIVDETIARLQGKRQKHLATQPAVGTAPTPTPLEQPKTMEEAVKRFMEDPAYGEVIS